MMQHRRTQVGLRVTMASAERRAACSIVAVASVASLHGVRFASSPPATLPLGFGVNVESRHESLKTH